MPLEVSDDLLRKNPKLLNEIVRLTQKAVWLDECASGNCDNPIAFACESCKKQFCAMHAFNTNGFCPGCIGLLFGQAKKN